MTECTNSNHGYFVANGVLCTCVAPDEDGAAVAYLQDYESDVRRSDPDYSINHERGSVHMVDLFCAAIVGAVLAACLLVTARTPDPASIHLSTVTTPTTIAIPQATPDVPHGEIAPPAAVTVAPRPPKASEATTEATTAPETVEAAPPVVQLSCEVLSDGIDGAATPGNAGWYRMSVDNVTADANPTYVRNCTPAETN